MSKTLKELDITFIAFKFIKDEHVEAGSTFVFDNAAPFEAIKRQAEIETVSLNGRSPFEITFDR